MKVGDNMNKHEILKAFELSAAAYKDIQPFYPYTCTNMLNNTKLSVECFLRRQNDVLRITFRGTDTPENWKNDFKFWEKTIPCFDGNCKIKVHAGFLNSYKSAGIRGKILNAIDDEVKFIKISGHSLGAALGILCAFDVAKHFPDRNLEVVVFGCPRVGNRNFAKLYNQTVSKSIRVENGNDIVTKVPFPLLNPFFNYRHVGSKLHIGKKKLPFWFSAKDHRPTSYYSALLKYFL